MSPKWDTFAVMASPTLELLRRRFRVYTAAGVSMSPLEWLCRRWRGYVDAVVITPPLFLATPSLEGLRAQQWVRRRLRYSLFFSLSHYYTVHTVE
jgi:hypothetical protein